ncbi:MAG: hypothetical protein Q4C03_03415, partial [bacterium]|nr:hypothetical protein [bacterium]
MPKDFVSSFNKGKGEAKKEGAKFIAPYGLVNDGPKSLIHQQYTTPSTKNATKNVLQPHFL